MVLLKIALFILVITLTFYLSEKIMWIVYFLFNFRMWHLLFEKVDVAIFDNLSKNNQLLVLIVLSILTYLIVYSIIMKTAFPPLKYIYLGVLMFIIFANYTLGELLFFQDIWKPESIEGVSITEMMDEKIESVESGDNKIDYGWAVKVGDYLRAYFQYMIDLVNRIMPN